MKLGIQCSGFFPQLANQLARRERPGTVSGA
jgi:hypothetical protein